VEVEAPLYVVAELLEQKEQGKLLLHLVNFNVVREPAVRGIGVELRIPPDVGVRQVSLLTPEQEGPRAIPFRIRGTRIEFTVPQLEAYALLIVQ
jgi:hypothetical protein